MPSAEPLRVTREEGERLLALARSDPDRPVPQYPAWSLLDLVRHTGSIHARTVLVCRDHPQERVSAPRPGDDVDVLDWFGSTLDEMIEALSAADLDTPVWGFAASPTIGTWVSRMLVETGVHRWDAESAFAEPPPLRDEVAEAGLDEYAGMWLPRLPEVQCLEVNATDLGRVWRYGEGDPTASVEGPASDLYLRLMSRPSTVRLPDDWAKAVDGLEPPPR